MYQWFQGMDTRCGALTKVHALTRSYLELGAKDSLVHEGLKVTAVHMTWLLITWHSRKN